MVDITRVITNLGSGIVNTISRATNWIGDTVSDFGSQVGNRIDEFKNDTLSALKVVGIAAIAAPIIGSVISKVISSGKENKGPLGGGLNSNGQGTVPAPRSTRVQVPIGGSRGGASQRSNLISPDISGKQRAYSDNIQLNLKSRQLSSLSHNIIATDSVSKISPITLDPRKRNYELKDLVKLLIQRENKNIEAIQQLTRQVQLSNKLSDINNQLASTGIEVQKNTAYGELVTALRNKQQIDRRISEDNTVNAAIARREIFIERENSRLQTSQRINQINNRSVKQDSGSNALSTLKSIFFGSTFRTLLTLFGLSKLTSSVFKKEPTKRKNMFDPDYDPSKHGAPELGGKLTGLDPSHVLGATGDSAGDFSIKNIAKWGMRKARVAGYMFDMAKSAGKFFLGAGSLIKDVISGGGLKGVKETISSTLSNYGGKEIDDMFKVAESGLAKKSITKSNKGILRKFLGFAAKSLQPTKMISGVSLLIATPYAIERFKEGDVKGGLLEIASGLAACVPLAGTLASVAIDASLVIRDISAAVEAVETTNELKSKMEKLISEGGEDNQKTVEAMERLIKAYGDTEELSDRQILIRNENLNRMADLLERKNRGDIDALIFEDELSKLNYANSLSVLRNKELRIKQNYKEAKMKMEKDYATEKRKNLVAETESLSWFNPFKYGAMLGDWTANKLGTYEIVTDEGKAKLKELEEQKNKMLENLAGEREDVDKTKGPGLSAYNKFNKALIDARPWYDVNKYKDRLYYGIGEKLGLDNISFQYNHSGDGDDESNVMNRAEYFLNNFRANRANGVSSTSSEAVNSKSGFDFDKIKDTLSKMRGFASRVDYEDYLNSASNIMSGVFDTAKGVWNSVTGGGSFGSSIEAARSAVVEFARNLVGQLKYSKELDKRDISKSSGDCSSFVRDVYKNVFGISIGGDTGEQWGNESFGRKISSDEIKSGRENLQPGDLLYYNKGTSKKDGVGHVEMYMGGNQVLNHGGRETYGPYWKGVDLGNKFLGVRRIITEDTLARIRNRLGGITSGDISSLGSMGLSDKPGTVLGQGEMPFFNTPFMSPTMLAQGYQNSMYGGHKTHQGFDLGLGSPTDTANKPVYAMENGVIVGIKNSGPKENMQKSVEYLTDSGHLLKYMHVDPTSSLYPGKGVYRGDMLGVVLPGSETNPAMKYGSHLHFEVKAEGNEGYNAIHPNNYFKALNNITCPRINVMGSDGLNDQKGDDESNPRKGFESNVPSESPIVPIMNDNRQFYQGGNTTYVSNVTNNYQQSDRSIW